MSIEKNKLCAVAVSIIAKEVYPGTIIANLEELEIISLISKTFMVVFKNFFALTTYRRLD